MSASELSSRSDGVSNRNTIIIGNYVKSKVGSLAGIFDGLPFPQEQNDRRFCSPEEFYMWEYGWHHPSEYYTAYRRVRDLFGPNAFFECGASIVKTHSWGLLQDTKYLYNGVLGALNKLQEVNQTFNDIKIWIPVIKPHFDCRTGKISAVFIIKYSPTYEVNSDFISDAHIEGLLYSLPTVWGEKPANVKYITRPFDIFKLSEIEPEITNLDLDPFEKDNKIYIRDPILKERRVLAKKIKLLSQNVELADSSSINNPIYLGDYEVLTEEMHVSDVYGYLVEEGLRTNEHVVFPSKTILGAPYHVLQYESTKEKNIIKSLFNAMSLKLRAIRERKIPLEVISQIGNESKLKSIAYERLRKQHSIERRREAIITGGFAHEIRNAGAGGQYELNTLLDDNGEHNIFTKLELAATDLLKGVRKIETEYQIPKNALFKEIIPHIIIISDGLKKTKATFENVEEDLERIMTITGRIRKYSEMHEFIQGVDQVNVLSIFKRYTEIYKEIIQDLNIKYDVICFDDQFMLIGDYSHYDSLFRNIFINSLDAVKETFSKEITVKMQKFQDINTAEITINDSGVGISNENIDKIFDPFFSTKPNTGTGLGLNEAKRIVELYNGEISVNSVVQGGTQFIIKFTI